jgi:hypothetical protein
MPTIRLRAYATRPRPRQQWAYIESASVRGLCPCVGSFMELRCAGVWAARPPASRGVARQICLPWSMICGSCH